MAEIKVTADDSMTAMEEVAKKLGPDAFIISTSNSNGQITIVATNDAESYVPPPLKPLKLKSVQRVDNFKTVLEEKKKVQELKEGSANVNFMVPEALIANLESAIASLSKIKNANLELPHQKVERLTDFYTVGLTREAAARAGITTGELSVGNSAKGIAKTFVSGRSDEFYKADLLLVSGLPGSGKSTVIKKLEKNLTEENTPPIIRVFEDVRSAADFTRASAWLQKHHHDDQRHIAILEISDASIIDANVFGIAAKHSSVNVCIVNVSHVGASHNFIVKNVRTPTVQNEFLILTKLDICDLSIPEISAYIEIGAECLFFSGHTGTDDGLYPARVDQIANHINDLVEHRTKTNG
jgi:energy-coupling factor transporter ATP-binding protein EcfA2